MKVFRSLGEYEQGENAVATIGTFDGVHRGHRVILNRLQESAREAGGESIVISFHPHPRLVLFPDDNPLRLLHTLEEKIEMLEELGIDKFLVIPFTRQFSRTTSETFIEDILVRTVGIRRIVIGYDHHFGKNRTGGLKEMQDGGERFGFEVEEIPAQMIDDATVSSTKIRRALGEGEVQLANRYLGYDYQFSGKVVRGQQLGRKLGFPTANLAKDEKMKLIPADGVYFVRCTLNGTSHFGMMNIGKKPTAGEFQRSLEVNLFDFERDIYGEGMRVTFLDRIRDEKKFSGLDALKAQIAKDEAACRALIPSFS